MSKAILVMDMPENCGKCDIVSYDEMEEKYCPFYQGINFDFDNSKNKPDWCPLKEVPEEIGYDDIDEYGEQHDYAKGWNDCVQEILKGSD